MHACLGSCPVMNCRSYRSSAFPAHRHLKKNAIMIVDFALEAEPHEGSVPKNRFYQACLIRFRPIMMTTMAALFGAVPLAPHRAGIEENLPVRAAS
jgi:hypothetical protein